MAASAANDPMVPALTGPQNYPIWRQSLKSLLNSKGLWKLVDGKETHNPSKPMALGSSAWESEFSTSTDLAYAERNELAYDLLIINIDPSLQAHVAHCKDDGKAAWETFKRLFDPSNITPPLGCSYAGTCTSPRNSGSRFAHDNEVCDAILIGVEERYREMVDMLGKRGGYTLKEVKESLLKAEKELPAVSTPVQSMEGNRKQLLGAGADINVSPSTPLRPAPSKRPHSPGPAGQTDVDKKRSRSSRKPRFVPVLPADAGNSTPVANSATDGAVVPTAGAANAAPVVAGTSTSLVPASSTTTPVPATTIPTTDSRPFTCLFGFASCSQTFSSKNEWKRHINHIHLQLYYWRCDFPGCANRKAYFNRKDLFGQHLKRMHAPANSGEIQERCKKERRKPPERSVCGFCSRVFEGQGGWEACVDHVGEHYTNGATGRDWKTDEGFVDWAVREGVVMKGEGGQLAAETRVVPID
ncbi:hypothetical protein BZA77DRAFT_366360 [Pyronema omphalodes]|nr:hypothetical protein BZA77DRAFT_366360 [Pyronema omphalodes]